MNGPNFKRRMTRNDIALTSTGSQFRVRLINSNDMYEFRYHILVQGIIKKLNVIAIYI